MLLSPAYITLCKDIDIVDYKEHVLELSVLPLKGLNKPYILKG